MSTVCWPGLASSSDQLLASTWFAVANKTNTDADSMAAKDVANRPGSNVFIARDLTSRNKNFTIRIDMHTSCYQIFDELGLATKSGESVIE